MGLSPMVDIIQALPDFSKVPGIDYPLFTQEGLLLTVMLLLPILYDLIKRRGGKSSLIQYSVFQTDRRRVAVAAKKLAEHYGASTEVFKGQKTSSKGT